LRDAIANERAALKRELHLEQRQAWREFVTDRAHADDDAAISALRGLRYREQRVEREHDMETPDFALRGAGDASRASCGIFATLDARVERNGDVSYRWRDGGEAFRDRGPEIAFRDTSDAASPRGSSSRAPSGATRSRFTAAQTSKSVPCASPSNAGYTSTIRNCKFASASSSSNSNVLDRKIESCCASAPVIAPSSATARMSAGADERSYFLSLFAGAGGPAEVGCVVVGTQSGIGTFGPRWPFSAQSGGGGCCRLSLSLILVRACSRSG